MVIRGGEDGAFGVSDAQAQTSPLALRGRFKDCDFVEIGSR
jgi:hypothetical protein